MRGISWLAEKLLASQEGLCSMELFSIWNYIYVLWAYRETVRYFGSKERLVNSVHFMEYSTLFPCVLTVSLLQTVSTGYGALSASCPKGTRGYFPKGKAARPEVYDSPPPSAEERTSGAVPLFPLYAFMELTETPSPLSTARGNSLHWQVLVGGGWKVGKHFLWSGEEQRRDRRCLDAPTILWVHFNALLREDSVHLKHPADMVPFIPSIVTWSYSLV
jgi:hypothetical protein